MQNFGNLAFVNYDCLTRFLGAQTYGKEKSREPLDNMNMGTFEQNDKVERRIRDRRRKQV